MPRRPGILRLLVTAAMALAGLGAAVPAAAAAPAPDIRLVLVIVVDQLRGDMVEEYAGNLGSGGFVRFLEQGVVYRQASMAFAPTSTAPGHATLATGALPPGHGIPANQWLDRNTGDEVYCVSDLQHRLLGRRTRRDDGTSPARLQAETFGDVIVAAAPGRNRVFAIAGKDRSAILLAGHRGKAVWYDRYLPGYGTSNFYFSAPPDWLQAFNDTAMTALDRLVWNPSRPGGEYRFRGPDGQPWERDYKGLGRTFPHRLNNARDVGAAFRFLPQSDEKTVALAMALVEVECLGCGTGTDMLAIGLSATDYVGHAFGPDSLEWEDNLYRLDSLLARLLSWIDRRIGLENVLVALSADHGIPSAPEYLAARGVTAGRVPVPDMIAGLRDHLAERFGLEGDPLTGARMPNVYLNGAALAAAGVDPAEAQRISAEYLSRTPGVAAVLTRSDLLAGRVPDTVAAARMAAGFHPEYSGDLIVLQREFWYLDKDPDYYAAAHGSPYDYDAHVPMMFLAPGVAPGRVERKVGTEDFAPTINGYLGLPPPDRSEGRFLPELRPVAGNGSYNSRDGRPSVPAQP